MTDPASIEKVEQAALISRTLRHYSQRLLRMREDKEVKVGNMVIETDLNQLIKDTDDALKMLGLQKDNYLAPFKHENKGILLNALECYSHDLKEAKGRLDKELGTTTTLIATGTEIKTTDELRASLDS